MGVNAVQPGEFEIATGSTALVWGGLGFLGQHMVARLLEAGVSVSVLCRPRHLYPEPHWAKQVKWFELHGSDNDAVMLAAVSSADVIYDFAGSSGAVASNQDPLHSLHTNCSEQLRLLSACEQAGRRPHVVFASSWLVYGETANGSVNETHATAPRSMYAAHKLCGENYLRIFAQRGKLTYSICRISNPYGFDASKPGKTYKILNSFLQSALAGAPICLFGSGRQLRDFIYIADLAEALLRCGSFEAARNETFNIGTGQSVSLAAAVDIIGELVTGVQVVFKPWPSEYLAVEAGDYTADTSKAEAKLRFAPGYDLRNGLESALRQYQRYSVSNALSA
jgi:UDP-glucose 4-epimerase